MTAAQIDWARSHDWFHNVTDDGLGIIVKEHAPLAELNPTQHDMPPVVYRTFYDYRALRRWAGC